MLEQPKIGDKRMNVNKKGHKNENKDKNMNNKNKKRKQERGMKEVPVLSV